MAHVDPQLQEVPFRAATVATDGPLPGDILRRLLKNSVLAVVARSISILVLVISVPMLLDCLGAEGYGVWESLMAIAATTAIFQLVINGTVQWQVSMSFGCNNVAETVRITRIGIGTTVLLTALITPLMWVVHEPFVSALQISASWTADALWILPALVAITLLGGVNQTLLAVVIGHQRAGLAAVAQAAGAIAACVASIGLLLLGANLAALLWGCFIGFVAFFTLIYPMAAACCPGISLIPLCPTRRELAILGPFAGLLLLSNLTVVFRDQADKILLASLVSSTTTGYFVLAQRMAIVVTQVCAVASAPFTAAVGALYVRKDWESIRTLYSRTAPWMGAFAGLLTLLICVLREPLFVLWLGDDRPDAHGFLALLLLGASSAVIFAGPGVALAKGIGLPGLETAYTLVTLGLILVTKPLMVVGIGPTGAVASSAISWCAGGLFLLALLHRRVSLPREAAVRTLGIFAVTLLTSTFGWWVSGQFPFAVEGRAAAALILMMVGPFLGAGYLSLLTALRLIRLPYRASRMRHGVRGDLSRSSVHEDALSNVAA